MHSAAKQYVKQLGAIINTGITNAAATINEVAGVSLLMSDIACHVSGLRIDTPEEIARMLEAERQYRASTVVVSLHQPESQVYLGRVGIVFSSDRAAKLALLMLNDESSGTDMDALRNSVYLEIGNLVVNGVLEALAPHHDTALYSMPTYNEVISDELFVSSAFSDSDIIVHGAVEFSIENHLIQGRLALVLSAALCEQLLERFSSEHPSTDDVPESSTESRS
jgi:chemotaxis protein CheY-P-specific phosphatase CheC